MFNVQKLIIKFCDTDNQILRRCTTTFRTKENP